MTYTIEDIEGEVSRALRQLNDCRNNYSPTEFFDDLMARAEGALIHQQELLRRQHEAIVKLREELHYIAIANPRLWDEEVRDSFQQWAQNRARYALKDTEGL